MFFKGSRYENVATATIADEHGRTVRYKLMRVLGDEAPDGEHVVRQGVRIDQIAALRLGDPEKFWRLCDANRAAWPPELVAEVGRRLLVPSEDG
jgi:hypothetical protein